MEEDIINLSETVVEQENSSCTSQSEFQMKDLLYIAEFQGKWPH